MDPILLFCMMFYMHYNYNSAAAGNWYKFCVYAILQVVASTHSNHGWRFVNRYTNRSNGGIPIFSEERSKERAEKVCRQYN